MHIGVTYDLRSDYLALGYSAEATAEFDAEETIIAVCEALVALGHQVARIGGIRKLTAQLAAGKRWDASGFYKTSFRAACRMAVPPGSDPEEFPPRGIGHVRLHDLRHTFASEQLRSGASLFEVQRLMGHADINLVARTYGHLSQHSAEQAIARAAAHREAARSATA